MIKQGYMVRVTSWENDGDCYKTNQFDGLSKSQARSLVDFCEFLATFSQEPANNIDFADYFYSLGLYFPLPNWEAPNQEQNGAVQEYFQDLAYEVVGSGYESDLLRVCDSWDVHYVPVDILEVEV